MSPCDEFAELISARLDGELSPFEEKRLEAHLARCAPCRELADELDGLHHAMAGLPRLDVPAGLTEQITAAVASHNVTPITAKKKSRTWKSLAALAAVLVLAVVGAGMQGFFGSSTPQFLPEADNDRTVYTVGLKEPDPPGLARTALFPDQDVLTLCAAQLFPEGKLTAEPVYDPDTSTLQLALAGQGTLTLTCVELNPEAASSVELAFDGGTVLTYLVDLTAGTVTPAE